MQTSTSDNPMTEMKSCRFNAVNVQYMYLYYVCLFVNKMLLVQYMNAASAVTCFPYKSLMHLQKCYHDFSNASIYIDSYTALIALSVFTLFSLACNLLACQQ